MDGAFWGYGLVAVLIAVLASSVELLSKYQARSPREIFFSWYYVSFASLNALACFLVYWAIPALGGVAVKSEILPSLNQPLIRAITAGLGYLLIARASILDITVRGATLGVGFDGIYNSVAQYILSHHAKAVRRKIIEDFRQVYGSTHDPPVVFLSAARHMAISHAETNEQRVEIRDRLDLALRGNPPPANLCLTLYLLIRDYTADRVDAQSLIRDQQAELEKSLQEAARLRQELFWIYQAP